MKKKFLGLIMGCIIAISFCACSTTDPEMSKFKSDVDKMCTDLVAMDQKINAIDSSSDKAVSELLGYLDELDMRFARFAELDFPEEYDYLEPVSDEASSYMKEAVKYFHESYKNDTYSEHNASYAQANYERAYKRIQVIYSCLRGETITSDATK